jgi:uncharacterized protein (DUF736 family)
MAGQDRDMSGVLFKNDRRENDRQPDYNGRIQVNGEDFWLSAWIKEGKSGVKFMSLAVKPKDAEQRPAQSQASEQPVDDGIPF